MAGALDIIRVIAEMAYVGQQILNVYHVISPSPTADSLLIDDVAAWLDEAYGYVNAFQDNGYGYSSIRVLNLSDDSEIGVVDWPGLVGGSVSGATGLPSGVAALITQPTSTLGSRGRKFIAGISETYQSDSLWDPTFLTGLADMAAVISAPFIGLSSGNSWAPCVVSTGLIPRPITGYQVTNIPAYQRRRREGVGS